MSIPRSSPLQLLVLGSLLFAAACGPATLPPEKDDATPSPNSATADQWKSQAVGQPEELFIGRFPGVQVYRQDGGLSVRIRGQTSVNSGNEPLYVIDGMIIDAGPGGALMGINPQDIQKIEVLKDIGSTAMYGSRGANGVILITTKRGK
ncbi:MAG TPA: TonB-dependent receptor plug domain-containing protein [Longimicrobiales bacterium]